MAVMEHAMLLTALRGTAVALTYVPGILHPGVLMKVRNLWWDLRRSRA